MKSGPSTDSSLSPQNRLPEHKTPPLVQALIQYDQHLRRRFHVPAHAGLNLIPNEWDLIQEPYRYDLTELDGLDVLSEPEGVIADAQAEIASIFGVAHSFMLINGASVGLIAAMLAAVKPGDKVLLSRNVHRSVLSGLILTGATPIWMLPERLPEWGLWGAVQPESVQAAFTAHPDIKAVFITAPTYEGIGSDIQTLAGLCHQHDASLIVDEAHGSLWPFHADLPTSACHLSADVVIHSMHKTGGSLTQSALAHLPHGSRVQADLFQQALNTLQTTSPSYLLMSNLDAACHALHGAEGRARIDQLLTHTQQLRRDLQQAFHHYRLMDLHASHPQWDPCKLYFINPTEPGENWGARLEEEQQIAYESASPYGVLYLANLGLQPEDFQAFQQTLMAADQAVASIEDEHNWFEALDAQNPSILIPEMKTTPRDAFFAPGERIASGDAIGRIAKETIVHCPPGIPVLFPGELIQAIHQPFLPEDVLVIR